MEDDDPARLSIVLDAIAETRRDDVVGKVTFVANIPRLDRAAARWAQLAQHQGAISTLHTDALLNGIQAAQTAYDLLSGEQAPEPSEVASWELKLYIGLSRLVESIDELYAKSLDMYARDRSWSVYRIRVATELAATEQSSRAVDTLFPALYEVKRLTEERTADVSELGHLRDAAAKAAEDARQSADKAALAAGQAGAARLSAAMSEYGTKQLGLAHRYRVTTIVMLSVIVGSAVLLLIPQFTDTEIHWGQVTYKIAVLLALSALTTYIGRQASRHQRLGDWAASLDAQLRSFPSFVDQVKDEKAVAELYANFSRRMLSAPPEGGTSKSSSSDTQLVEIFLNFLRTTR